MEEKRTKKFTCNLRADMHQALKIRAAMEKRTMSEIMEEVLSIYRIPDAQQEKK